MSNDLTILKKALISSTIMFIVTSVGHVLVYLVNKEKEGDED